MRLQVVGNACKCIMTSCVVEKRKWMLQRRDKLTFMAGQGKYVKRKQGYQ